MSTLQQLREDFGRSWDALREGWRYLSNRASGALTKFIPPRRSEQQDVIEGFFPAQPFRWGLMAAEVFDDEENIIVKRKCLV